MNLPDRTRYGDRVELRELRPEDAAAIHQWPPYVGEFAPLDYALRPGGWLDMFPPSPVTRRFAVIADDALAGFTLLTDITREEAEFYVALHPARAGHGVGRLATLHTVHVAFHELRLRRVYLKVRTWHERGIALYQSVGFRRCGEGDEAVQGQLVRFVHMQITAESWFDAQGAGTAKE